MESKLIVQNAIDFVAAIYGLEKQVMADGKINITDLGYLMSVIPVLSSPSSKGIFKNLPEALGKLSQQEIIDVLAYLATKFAVKELRSQRILSEATLMLAHAYQLSKALGEPKV